MKTPSSPGSLKSISDAKNVALAMRVSPRAASWASVQASSVPPRQKPMALHSASTVAY
jgi:hypothetical protein